MVNLSTATELPIAEPDEPPHSGYSPRSPSPPRQDDGNYAASSPPPAPQLNPGHLTQRLLASLAPSAAQESSQQRQFSSSAPDLTRAHDSPSPAHLEPEIVDKVERTNSFVVPTRTRDSYGPPFNSSSSATHEGIGPGGDLGARDGHVTPAGGAPLHNPGPRPALLSKLLEPKKPVGRNPSFRQCLVNTAKYSWLNVMFVFVPVAWAMEFSHQSSTIIFVFSMLAIVPCAATLGFATEELALRVGDALGGLLNATFGNAVELIISILALAKGELDIVRSSMLGSILSNCLLVLGGCLFAGGVRFFEQTYSMRAAQLNINLLGIAVTAIVVPVAFHYFIESEASGSIEMADDSVLRLSRGIAFILLFVYASYLVFQLWTHSYLYVPAPPRDPRAPPPPNVAALLLYQDGPQPPTEGRVFRIPSWGSSTSASSGSTRSALSRTSTRTTARSRASSVAHPGARNEEDLGAEEAGLGQQNAPVQFDATDAQTEEMLATGNGADLEKGVGMNGPGEKGGAKREEWQMEAEEPKLSPWFAVVLLTVTTAVTGVTAEFLVSSIDGLTQTGNVSREFVALILLPVVGNSAEHFTAITVATKNKLDLSIAVAVGSSIQIALFVIPVLVLLGWCIGQPLDFLFDPFETLLVFLCVASVNWAISDGRTQWMEGMSLMAAYLVIALCAWFYPGSQA
ncbi:hypothetical protein JCM8547_003846 [Rhodosporidiobolus lusitaniae]